MGPVGGAEGVVHVGIGEVREGAGKVPVVLLLARVEPEVFEQQQLTLAESVHRRAGVRADAVRGEGDPAPEQVGQAGRYGAQGQRSGPDASGPPQVGDHRHARSGGQELAEGRDARADARIVGDHAIAERDVQVRPDQDPHAADVAREEVVQSGDGH